MKGRSVVLITGLLSIWLLSVAMGYGKGLAFWKRNSAFKDAVGFINIAKKVGDPRESLEKAKSILDRLKESNYGDGNPLFFYTFGRWWKLASRQPEKGDSGREKSLSKALDSFRIYEEMSKRLERHDEVKTAKSQLPQ